MALVGGTSWDEMVAVIEAIVQFSVLIFLYLLQATACIKIQFLFCLHRVSPQEWGNWNVVGWGIPLIEDRNQIKRLKFLLFENKKL